jgi:phosphate transport system substrate-binding protein
MQNVKIFSKMRFLLFIFGLYLLQSCGGGSSTSSEKTRYEYAKIVIDDSFQKLLKTSIDTYESQYPKAKFIPKYASEDSAIQLLMNDKKVNTIVISRELTKRELYILKTKDIEVRSNKIATDGVAIIVHPSNSDSVFTVDDIKNILLGKKATWKDGRKIQVVFDKPYSANFNYLKKLCDNGPIENHVTALKSNQEVIKFIKENPNSLGVIGVNWISDQHDFDTKYFLNGIRVASIGKDKNSLAFQPYAGVLYTKEYPLTRDIWMINYAPRSSVNSSLINFMLREPGQLIVQQSSLVPANAPIRLIEMRTE